MEQGDASGTMATDEDVKKKVEWLLEAQEPLYVWVAMMNDWLGRNRERLEALGLTPPPVDEDRNFG